MTTASRPTLRFTGELRESSRQRRGRQHRFLPVQMDKPEPGEVRTARTVARVLDGLIPLPGGARLGLDAVAGLIPGVGDLAGALASGYIVLLAIRAGASRAAVIRMIGNIVVDTVVGSIPLLGDIFDVGWRSNSRNVAIMERDLGATGVRRHTSKAFLAAIVLGVLVALAGLAYVVGAFLWLVIARLS
jgi:hypothetical protein